MTRKHYRMIRRSFTLLELLIVAAILAAIAGTASIALQDTDARASAAAHVAMMDELNKGVRTFRVLNRNTLPTGFDSLLQTPAADGAAGVKLAIAAIDDIEVVALTDGIGEILNAGGINSLQYVVSADDGTTPGAVVGGYEGCEDLDAHVASRANAVVAGNIFLTPAGNGCGYNFSLADADAAAGYQAPTCNIAVWSGGEERITGQPGVNDAVYNTNGNKAFMAVGLGPASNLFDAKALGGMTSVPVYRHVGPTEYNRFIALFDIGTFGAAGAITPADQVVFVGTVDGAGDTKEEELGEWDGTRNTI